MGSPVSPIVANLYIEHFEREALQSSPIPRHWFMYVDDTFVIQQKANKQVFLDHTNSMDPAIQFTVTGNQENVAIPFPGYLGQAPGRPFPFHYSLPQTHPY